MEGYMRLPSLGLWIVQSQSLGGSFRGKNGVSRNGIFSERSRKHLFSCYRNAGNSVFFLKFGKQFFFLLF